VQPSLYGEDNGCLLDALREAGADRARGVVMMDDAPAADGKLERWHTLGVRGIRIICFPPHHAVHSVRSPMHPEPGWADEVRPRIERRAALARELGWHLDLLAPGWLVCELLPTLRALPVDFALAHLGMFPAAEGPGQPGFKALLDLLADGSGRCWVKLTGPYRISQQEGFTDVEPMASAALAVAPERVLWGSDYPHLSWADRVSTADMADLLHRLVPDAADRTRVLVHNPALLYGFGAHQTWEDR
jgi:2-pyrone-4,6-dicarboxylate lactonase